MRSRTPVYRARSDVDQTNEMRRVVQQARELLRQSPPDTFLGRKTFEPFPKQANKPANRMGSNSSGAAGRRA
jgi:hypothetical protein